MAKTKLPPQIIINKGDPEYPERLNNIPGPPRKLYVRGNVPEPNTPSVAIIGARQCSRYGEDMAKWFGMELAAKGVQIISGMARGVDGISQWAAIRSGGKSYAVLGCGTDICYPGENRGIYEALLENGGIISEFPEGTPPIARNFPSRNRIISGLADVLVVIEAKEKSGTLITVDYALSQGKDVFALPGRIGDIKSGGCNSLIKMGANMALSPGDILEALDMDRSVGKYMKAGAGQEDLEKASDYKPEGREIPVWDILSFKPLRLQDIYDRLISEGEDMSLTELMNVLMNMVLKKAVCTNEGAYIKNY